MYTTFFSDSRGTRAKNTCMHFVIHCFSRHGLSCASSASNVDSVPSLLLVQLAGAHDTQCRKTPTVVRCTYMTSKRPPLWNACGNPTASSVSGKHKHEKHHKSFMHHDVHEAENPMWAHRNYHRDDYGLCYRQNHVRRTVSDFYFGI